MRRCLVLFVLAASLLPAQTLLFKSGFESSTALGAIPGGQTNSYEQPFSGTDASTGYAWPMHLFGQSLGGIHLNGEPDALSGHFFNAIQTLTGHTGASTKALFVDIENYTNFQCCPQAVFESASLTQPMHSVYYSYWLMYPSSLATLISSYHSGYGREVSGWKSNRDFRQTMNISRNGTSGSILHGAIQADAGGKQASSGAGCPYIDWITGATGNDCQWFRMQSHNSEYTVPFGQWNHVEIYMNRVHGPGGRYFASINGHTVADFNYSFDSYGIDNEEVADLYWVNLYSSYFPMSHWIDDLEIWDSPPCASLPCDTHVGNLPSSFVSYPAAVGTVGAAFSFQPVVTHSPTSWSYNGYGSTGMPPGLSLNASTGLISGTPTTTGTYQIYINASNAAGGGTQVFKFQINSGGIPAPVIKNFGAYPPSVSSGNPSTLYANVLGAGTVTLSVDQGVGALSGLSTSKIVNPTISTTYTLTAHNSAGTTTASTTVSVTGGGSAPSISSFTASPTSVVSGGSASLSLSSSGGTSCSINQGVGTVGCNSITSVHPTFTTTYTATATNGFGSDTASATVTVTGITTPPFITSFTATPSTPIVPGASVSLAWASTGGTSAILNGSPVSLSGTQAVTPLVTTAYVLVVSNSAGPVSRTVTVTVGALPVISSFTATPSTIALGSSSTLALASTGGTSCSIDQGVGSVTCNSSTPVTPLTSKLYTVTVTNSFGSVTAKALVGVSISALVGASVVDGQVVIH